MTDAVTFRPIRPEDEPFLCRLYASTRADEMALVDWDEAQKEAFLADAIPRPAHLLPRPVPRRRRST